MVGEWWREGDGRGWGCQGGEALWTTSFGLEPHQHDGKVPSTLDDTNVMGVTEI